MNAGMKNVQNKVKSMTIFDDIPENKKSNFMDMVDKIVMMSDNDLELKEAIKYLDGKAKITETSIYEVIYAVLGKWEMDKRVKEWLKAKKNDNLL